MSCSITILYGTYCGATIAFCEGLRYIADNLKEFHVSVFVAVPLVLETMAKKIQKAIADSGKQGLINAMTKISHGLLKCKIDVRKKLFKPVLKQFDEYLRVVLYGAAPMDKATIEWYKRLRNRIDTRLWLNRKLSSTYSRIRRKKESRLHRNTT